MEPEGTAPEWVMREVIPQVEGNVRSVHLLTPKAVIVFGRDHALFAEKGALSGVKLYRVDYPPGFVVNGSHCPHCHEVILEPIGKVARLAMKPTAKPTAKARTKGKAKRH